MSGEGVCRVEVGPELAVSRGVEAWDPKLKVPVFVGASDGHLIEISSRGEQRVLLPIELAGKLASAMPLLMMLEARPEGTYDAELSQLGLEPMPRS